MRSANKERGRENWKHSLTKLLNCETSPSRVKLIQSNSARHGRMINVPSSPIIHAELMKKCLAFSIMLTPTVLLACKEIAGNAITILAFVLAKG